MKHLVIFGFIVFSICSCKTQESREASSPASATAGTSDNTGAASDTNQITVAPDQINKILVVSDNKGLGLDQQQQQQLLVGGAIAAGTVAAITALFTLRGGHAPKVEEEIQPHPNDLPDQPGVPRPDELGAGTKAPETTPNPVVVGTTVGGTTAAKEITVKINGTVHNINIENISEANTKAMFSVESGKANEIVHASDPTKINALFEDLKNTYEIIGKSDDNLVAADFEGSTYLMQGGDGKIIISKATVKNFNTDFIAKNSSYYPLTNNTVGALSSARDAGYTGQLEKTSDMPLQFKTTDNRKLQVDTEYVVSKTNKKIYRKFVVKTI